MSVGSGRVRCLVIVSNAELRILTLTVDPTTFVAAAFFLAVIAVLASLLPAVRAMRVDPVVALRDE
jgi:ABC-type lipoprotein release transport system permease subunit